MDQSALSKLLTLSAVEIGDYVDFLWIAGDSPMTLPAGHWALLGCFQMDFVRQVYDEELVSVVGPLSVRISREPTYDSGSSGGHASKQMVQKSLVLKGVAFLFGRKHDATMAAIISDRDKYSSEARNLTRTLEEKKKEIEVVKQAASTKEQELTRAIHTHQSNEVSQQHILFKERAIAVIGCQNCKLPWIDHVDEKCPFAATTYAVSLTNKPAGLTEHDVLYHLRYWSEQRKKGA